MYNLLYSGQIDNICKKKPEEGKKQSSVTIGQDIYWTVFDICTAHTNIHAMGMIECKSAEDGAEHQSRKKN